MAPRTVDKANALVNLHFRQASTDLQAETSAVPSALQASSVPEGGTGIVAAPVGLQECSPGDLIPSSPTSGPLIDEVAFKRITSMQRPRGLEWSRSRKALELAIHSERKGRESE